MFRQRAISSAALSLLVALGATVNAAESRIGVEEARKIAFEALKARGAAGPSIEMTLTPYAKNFYTFEATWPTPDGSPNLGSFAVNFRTGDVWQVVVCRYISSPAIKKMQQAIRSRFRYTREQYRKFHARTPAC